MPLGYVTAPPVTPSKYGLLSAAVVVDSTDGHLVGLGFEYEPDFCGASHTTAAACMAKPNAGSLSVSVNASRVATLTGTGAPPGAFPLRVDFGDGTPAVWVQSGAISVQHT